MSDPSAGRESPAGALPSLPPDPLLPSAPSKPSAPLGVLHRLNLLWFPPGCLQCGRLLNPLAQATAGFPFLCRACWAGLPWKDQAKSCRRCGSLTAEPERLRCPVCADKTVHLSRAWCAFAYSTAVRHWILNWKYYREEPLSRMLGALLAQADYGTSPLEGVNFVVPVPLHRKRLRRRGFNQAYLLAHHWLAALRRADHAAPPLRPDVLTRHRHTRPQVEVPRGEREGNVADAFSVPERPAGNGSPALAGASILLVDDLLTSGSTLNACATTLLAAGTARVTALVLARA